MNPKLEHKTFVGGLIAVLSTAIDANLLDDAQALLTAVRVLRPRMTQLDGIEASIAAQRGRWADALRLLDGLPQDAPDWETGASMRAYCLWASGDSRWRAEAEQLATASRDPDTIASMKRLLSLGGADGGANGGADADAAPAADRSTALPMMHFLAA